VAHQYVLINNGRKVDRPTLDLTPRSTLQLFCDSTILARTSQSSFYDKVVNSERGCKDNISRGRVCSYCTAWWNIVHTCTVLRNG